MNERIRQIATLANISVYDSETAKEYVDGAPHIKHASLRMLYSKSMVQVYDFAREYTTVPTVLDLGAGEGSATLPFLELGAKVTAVDVSDSQLSALQNKCRRFGDKLEVRCEDIYNTLKAKNNHYDVIVANSFLHHIPDYLSIIREAVALLSPYGQFFSFQDPLRYDTLAGSTRIFSTFAYFSWRVFKGDVLGGVRRRFRRMRGIYLENSMHDNAEYHVVRNGVDHKAIYNLFVDLGFDCSIERYFSTQSSLFQPIGTGLGLKNTFSIIAKRKSV